MLRTSSRVNYIFSISNLPNEILLLVFLALRDITHSVDDQLRLDCVSLAGVCRRWRSLVLTTSHFWTRLHIVIRVGALSRDYLETHVKRSANTLVDVVIYVARPPNPWVQNIWSPVFEEARRCLKVLRECSYRWKSLRIVNEVDNHSGVFGCVLSELGIPYAPALNEVQIICHSSGWITSVRESFQLLTSTYIPSLKKLTLEGCDSNILPRQFNPSSLTHLSLNFLCQYSHVTFPNSLIAFRDLLSSAQNLTSLEVHRRVLFVEHTTANDELDRVSLPALRSLSIIMGTEKPSYLSVVLRTIAAPNLRHFAIYGNSLTWEESSLLDFSSPAFFLLEDQTPRFPSVHKLTMKNMLQSMHGPGKNIYSIFTAFPFVTDVVLDHDVREIADYLAVESYDRRAPLMWPCLKHLTIEMPPVTKFHYLQQLLEWLRLRRAGGFPLPVVVIRYELQQTGMKQDARDLTAIRKIVNDASGSRTSDTKEVAKQLRKLGTLVDLSVILWDAVCTTTNPNWC